MKKIQLILMLIISSNLLLTSCSDLETDLYVINTEAPDDNILASDPIALAATSEGLYRAIHQANHSYNSPSIALNTMADVNSCSWGNFGMRDLSSEPRVSFNNDTSYGNDVTNTYFNALYTVLSDANTIVLAVNNGTEFSNPDLMLTIAKFNQALAIGYNALIFDKVWLSDENGAINDGVATGYLEAMDFALEKLDEAIAIAKNNSFTVPANYFTFEMTSEQLAGLMNSYGARFATNIPRNSTQRNNVDWTKVKAYAESGLDIDYSPIHDDINWYSLYHTYLNYPGWARTDLRIIGLMDPDYPSYWPDNTTILPEAQSLDARLESDFQYLNGQTFRPERGEYHYSSYRYKRHDEYLSEWTIPTSEMPVAETKMYLAEANLRLNNLSVAASIINNSTRITRGKLDPVSANTTEITNAIFYEMMVELGQSSPFISFCTMRGYDLLQSGTLLHFPVPGAALIAIPEDNYTFGGSEGTPGEDFSTGGWR